MVGSDALLSLGAPSSMGHQCEYISSFCLTLKKDVSSGRYHRQYGVEISSLEGGQMHGRLWLHHSITEGIICMQTGYYVCKTPKEEKVSLGNWIRMVSCIPH